MNPLTATILIGLCAVSAQADYVQITPAIYSKITRTEANIGNWRNMWVLETERTETLNGGRLEIINKVWWHASYGVSYIGSKSGATPMMENRDVYSQEGDIHYAPLGGQHIRHIPAGKGTFLSETNNINAADMEQIDWSPDLIGRIANGEATWRTEQQGTIVACSGQNLSNHRRLVVFKCSNGQAIFDYEFEFAPGETRIIGIGVTDANRRGAVAVPMRQPISYFMLDFVDPSFIREWPL